MSAFVGSTGVRAGRSESPGAEIRVADKTGVPGWCEGHLKSPKKDSEAVSEAGEAGEATIEETVGKSPHGYAMRVQDVEDCKLGKKCWISDRGEDLWWLFIFLHLAGLIL